MTTPKEMTLADAIAFYEKQGLVVYHQGDAKEAYELLRAHGYKIFNPKTFESHKKRVDAGASAEWSHDFHSDVPPEQMLREHAERMHAATMADIASKVEKTKTP